MARLFGFSLLVTYLSVIESAGETKSCLYHISPGNVMWKKTGHTAVLPCTIKLNCSAEDLHYEWFAFKQNVHLRLNQDSNNQKYSLEGATLKIKSLNANDSGIYHCAAVSKGKPAPGVQHVGMGTTLEVRDVLKTMMRNSLLWIAFIFLAVYSLAVVTLIILKKHGCKIFMCKRTYTSDKNNSSRKIQFRDVLQEMYSRRSLKRSKQTVSGNRSQVEAASSEFNSSLGDIYQNV